MSHNLDNAYKLAMRRLATTVAIATVGQSRAQWHGMAITALTSVSVAPSMLAICVRQASGLGRELTPHMPFAVSLLAQRHHALVPVFAGEVKARERFDHGHWEASVLGPPVLADGLATFCCTANSIIELGSHLMVAGEIRAARSHGLIDPLLWLDGSLGAANIIPRP